MNKNSELKKTKFPTPIVPIALFSIMSLALLTISFAALIPTTHEAENSTISEPALAVSDASASDASNGSFLEFRSELAPPPSNCSYPDFVAIEYGDGNENQMFRYTYNPPANDFGTQRETIFDTSNGHRSIHGFSVIDTTAYVPRYNQQNNQFELLAYDVDSTSPDFGSFEVISNAYGIGHTADKEGNRLFFIGPGTGEISRLDLATGSTTTLVSSPQNGGSFSQFGIQYGPDGRLYVLNQSDSLEVYNPENGNFIEIFATGTGSGRYGQRDIAFDSSGDLYVSNGNVLRFHGPGKARAGQLIDVMDIGDNGWPHGITFHPTTGELFITTFQYDDDIGVYDFAAGIQPSKSDMPLDGGKDIQFIGCSS